MFMTMHQTATAQWAHEGSAHQPCNCRGPQQGQTECPCVLRTKPHAWLHPSGKWAHVDRSEVEPHCQKDGEQPIPLYK